jgi:hypothetical protein
MLFKFGSKSLPIPNMIYDVIMRFLNGSLRTGRGARGVGWIHRAHEDDDSVNGQEFIRFS